MKESLASRLMHRQSQDEITKLNNEITELQRRLTAVYALCDEYEHRGTGIASLMTPETVRQALKPRD